MRLVIQRVLSASVKVGDDVVGSIGPGILCLVGVGPEDCAAEAKWAATKVLNSRLWDEAEGKQRPWMQDVKQIDGGVLFVSQFTLYGYLKGNRPDFHLAAPGDAAQALFDSVVAEARKAYVEERVATGSFGAHMAVESVNDGPVTIWLDSNDKATTGKPSKAAAVGGGVGGGGEGGGAQAASQPKQKKERVKRVLTPEEEARIAESKARSTANKKAAAARALEAEKDAGAAAAAPVETVSESEPPVAPPHASAAKS